MYEVVIENFKTEQTAYVMRAWFNLVQITEQGKLPLTQVSYYVMQGGMQSLSSAAFYTPFGRHVHVTWNTIRNDTEELVKILQENGYSIVEIQP